MKKNVNLNPRASLHPQSEFTRVKIAAAAKNHHQRERRRVVTMKALMKKRLLFQVSLILTMLLKRNRQLTKLIMYHVEDELEFLDTSLIIPTGRRTRGKKIDYKQFGADPEDEE